MSKTLELKKLVIEEFGGENAQKRYSELAGLRSRPQGLRVSGTLSTGGIIYCIIFGVNCGINGIKVADTFLGFIIN